MVFFRNEQLQPVVSYIEVDGSVCGLPCVEFQRRFSFSDEDVLQLRVTGLINSPLIEIGKTVVERRQLQPQQRVRNCIAFTTDMLDFVKILGQERDIPCLAVDQFFRLL